MLSQNLSKAPNFVKCAVKWGGRDADHIWLAEIALHSRSDQFIVQLLRMLVRYDRQLTTARIRIAGSDDAELF